MTYTTSENYDGWRCHVCGYLVPYGATHTTHGYETNLQALIAGADSDEASEGAGAELARLQRERDEWEVLAMRYLKEIQELRAILGRVHAATAPREEVA